MSELLHYEDRGGGPCVVFLHPTPVDHCFWRPVAALLEPDYRVMLPDLPGHGLSPLGMRSPAWRPWAAPSFACSMPFRSTGRSSVAAPSAAICCTSCGGRRRSGCARSLSAARSRTPIRGDAARPYATIASIEQQGTAPFFNAMLDTLVGAPAKERDPDIMHRLVRDDEAHVGGVGDRSAACTRSATRFARHCSDDTRADCGAGSGARSRLHARRRCGSWRMPSPVHPSISCRRWATTRPYEQPRLVGALLRRFAEEIPTIRANSPGARRLCVKRWEHLLPHEESLAPEIKEESLKRSRHGPSATTEAANFPAMPFRWRSWPTDTARRSTATVLRRCASGSRSSASISPGKSI